MTDVRVSPVDVRLRVVAIALEPALVLARIAAIPLDDVQRLVAAGYFREARARGHSFRAIARRAGKSLRTVTNLAKLASEQGALLETSQRLTWRRQIVVRVGEKGTAGLARRALEEAIPDAPEDVLEEEIAQLVSEGILSEDGGRLRAVARHLDMVQEQLAPRLESLRHFLRAVAGVAYRRFFVVDAEAEAFARVLSFSADRESLASLRSETYASLREKVFSLDAREGGAEDDKVQAMVAFAVVEEPTDPAWRPPRAE
jgi:DNA-binding MarR family transcriptional regulator